MRVDPPLVGYGASTASTCHQQYVRDSLCLRANSLPTSHLGGTGQVKAQKGVFSVK